MFAPFEIEPAVVAKKYDLLLAILDLQNFLTVEENDSVRKTIQSIVININRNSYSNQNEYKKAVCMSLSAEAAETKEDSKFKEVMAFLDFSIPDTANLAFAEERYKEVLEDLNSQNSEEVGSSPR